MSIATDWPWQRPGLFLAGGLADGSTVFAALGGGGDRAQTFWADALGRSISSFGGLQAGHEFIQRRYDEEEYDDCEYQERHEGIEEIAI